MSCNSTRHIAICWTEAAGWLTKLLRLLQKYFLALLMMAQRTNTDSWATLRYDVPSEAANVKRQTDAAQKRCMRLQSSTAELPHENEAVTPATLQVVLSAI